MSKIIKEFIGEDLVSNSMLDGDYSIVEVREFNMVGVCDLSVYNFEVKNNEIEMSEKLYKEKLEEDFRGSNERFLNEMMVVRDMSKCYLIKGGI